MCGLPATGFSTSNASTTITTTTAMPHPGSFRLLPHFSARVTFKSTILKTHSLLKMLHGPIYSTPTPTPMPTSRIKSRWHSRFAGHSVSSPILGTHSSCHQSFGIHALLFHAFQPPAPQDLPVVYFSVMFFPPTFFPAQTA